MIALSRVAGTDALRLFLKVWLVMSVLVYSFLTVAVQQGWFTLLSISGSYRSNGSVPLMTMFSIVVIGPVLEEYVFRYVPIVTARAFSMDGVWLLLVALVSSALFALIHSPGTLHFPVPQFIVGVAAFYLAYRTNIFHSIVLHAANNLGALAIPY
jgi:membrane protease YdiL (CAAX protease family)